MYFFFLEYFIVGKLIDKLLIVLDVEKVVIDVGWDEEKNVFNKSENYFCIEWSLCFVFRVLFVCFGLRLDIGDFFVSLFIVDDNE